MWLEDMYVSVFAGTPTVSQSISGYGEFSSNDFGNSLPLKVPMQPGACGLAGTMTPGNLQLASYHNTHMPMKTSCKISTAFTNDITQSATTRFYHGCRLYQAGLGVDPSCHKFQEILLVQL